ncbi:MAG: glycolate oxidase subunit GlcF [Undibacterium sp.]|nr:glycolate oxidase subunit GlcF [Undibacterium sp.]
MQTNLADNIKDTVQGQAAEAILRSCVHCGMCNATCPTYQLLGDELDGPRGRIYLIKQVLEGQAPTQKTQNHLDRCLTCLSCETTCPSGVKFGYLLDIGRQLVEEKVGRTWAQKLLRSGLGNALSKPVFFQQALNFGRKIKPYIPASIQAKIPDQKIALVWPNNLHQRKMLLLDGCVQPALAPNINIATAQLLDKLKIQTQLAPQAGCCGALALHLNDRARAIEQAKRNIDVWWPLLTATGDQRFEKLVMTASACGVMVKDYGDLLAQDQTYAEKAKLVAQSTLDISEVLSDMSEQLVGVLAAVSAKVSADVSEQTQERLSWHAPCTLQHGQQIVGKVEQLFIKLGMPMAACKDSHLCCGSAGTYSLLQPQLALQLRENKLAALQACQPTRILSANLGCQHHLQAGTATPVSHWVEFLNQLLPN